MESTYGKEKSFAPCRLNSSCMAIAYNEYKKTCKNGYPQYYGVMIDPVTGVETATEMNGSDWIASGQAQGYESLSLGCPPMYLAPGGQQVYSRKKPGVKFKSASNAAAYSVSLARRINTPPSLVAGLKKLAPHRSTLLMQIRNAGGHVGDPNNMMEVVTEYGRLHPELGTISGESREAVNDMKPKSGFDFGGLFGMIGQIVDGISDGVNNSNVAAFLNTWGTAFQTYMTNDFGEIRKTLNATQASPGAWGGWGPKGALDMLVQFQNTSWKDLKNTITTYCSQKGVDVPAVVKNLWEEQARLEADLRRQVANTGNAGGNTGSSNNLPGGNTTPIAGMRFDFMKWLPWIIGILVFFILLFVIVKSSSKRGKAA